MCRERGFVISIFISGTFPPALRAPVMEQWQRLGFESFGAWRRACEQDRRKQRAATKLAVATRPRVQWQPTTPRVQWQPTTLSLVPAAPSSQSPLPPSPPRLPRSDSLSRQTGALHEYVQVTPRGRRRHQLEATSPGGTKRVDEYFSPAGAQGQQQPQQREECFRRLAAAKRAAAAERTEAERDEAERAVSQAEARPMATIAECLQEDRKKGRRSCDQWCGDCKACRERMLCPPVTWGKRKRLSTSYAPCEARLLRMGYRRSELTIVYELLRTGECDDGGRELYESW